MRSILFFLFLVIPVIEIALFIQVGSIIGLFPTLATILLTAAAGAVLVRQQGFNALQDVRKSVDAGQPPVLPIAHGLMILVAGFLLITPGFATDTLGFLLLVPAFRNLAVAAVRSRFSAGVTMTGGGSRPHDPKGSNQDSGAPGLIIEGTVEDVTGRSDADGTSKRLSPWRDNNGPNA